MTQSIRGVLDFDGLHTESLRDVTDTMVDERIEVFVNDFKGERIAFIALLKLDQDRFPNVSGTDARRVEGLDHLQHGHGFI